ncbi:SpoU rRNA methylase family protein [Dokdonia sp. MED134]|uniref:TrmH family RNA methyltransferase n=1 Tax=Dokdonia sp. MED134 TaxID=313590 RepID=UPI000068AA3C|nr:TrmH family RNA methyltransferase [Dokdonia sp. MED134]EAQ40537.1 SpoU rRNA methylase family protein [Dokdonia sp. MED134]
MSKYISSLQNPTVKRLLQLQEKSRTRKKEGGFIIEGKREIELAIAGGYTITEVYYDEQLIAPSSVEELVGTKISLTSLATEVYKKVAYRGGTEGVIAFAKAKKTTLSELQLPVNPLILVTEAPEKPGNIGALLRTADAAAVDAVIIANPKTDLYNPNIIRSSVGCVFTTQIATGSTEEVISFLQEKDVAIYSAILQKAVDYATQAYTGGSAIVVGTEATGLSPEWRTVGTNIKIPMRGKIDSMNVSVAAGILIFEARRQRS